MRAATKLAVAGTAIGCALCVTAPQAVASNSYVAYLAGTRQNGQASETSPSEWTHFYAPGPVLTINYPRDLAPLIGTKTLDQSVAEGIAATHTALNGAGLLDGDTVTLVGVSQGAVVAQMVKRDLAGTDNVVLITYGDPTNTDGGFLGKLPFGIPGFITNYRADDGIGVSNTTYAIEYDIVADSPDLPNPVSWVNALMGAMYYHSTYSLESIPADPDAVVRTVVQTPTQTNEHVLIKTPKLPLVQPLRDMGVDENLVEVIEKPLKRIVDSGYTGNRTSDSTTTVNPMVTGNKVVPATGEKPSSTMGSTPPSLRDTARDVRAGLKKAADDTRATIKRLLKPRQPAKPAAQDADSAKDAA